MKLVNIGFGNVVSSARILAVISPDSAPVKRVMQEAKERSMLIDASFGRKTKSVLIMDTDHIILSSIPPETISARLEGKNVPEHEGEDE
ncbi:MAG: DUF370 domain-containing protein [Clostridia bacterium]|nr:DUF370 domain-containing protein [Clostridia bacterium]